MLLTFFIAFNARGQNKLSLGECEARFLSKNLSLLAGQYNIDMARAQVIQAGLWDNPYISAELNAVNPPGGKYFDVGSTGQKAFAISQLIYLGGKKQKEVTLAKANAQLAEYDFKDLMRNLKYELHSSYFNLFYSRLSVATIDRQLANLDSLISAYKVQVDKGNIPLKDVVRLQSLYLQLLNDRTDLMNSIHENQQKLNLLLASDVDIVPQPMLAEINRYTTPRKLVSDSLQNIAIQNRPDILSADASIAAAGYNLKWQKSLAVPDLTLGVSYDQRGGAFNNQANLTLGFPLVSWNRNQGNIKMAGYQLEQTKVNKEYQVRRLHQDIEISINKYNEDLKNYQAFNPSLADNFEQVYKGMYENFIKRNISLIEFTDFMESYSSSLIQHDEIRKSLVDACEQINYISGAPIF